MTLKAVKEALLTIGVPVSRYFTIKKTYPYIWWAEDSPGDTQHADNMMVKQAIGGTIHYFTTTEDDSNVPKIQTSLTMKGIPFELDDILPGETDSGIIHYIWRFTVGGF